MYQIRVCMKQGVPKRCLAQNVLNLPKIDLILHEISVFADARNTIVLRLVKKNKNTYV